MSEELMPSGTDMMPPDSERILDEIEIESTEHHFALYETLGEGAMGKVLLARDEDLLRKVAIKKIKGEVSRNQFLLDSFITEAQVTAQLEHPCIIPVYGLEVNQDGEMGYSMKRIEGQTLSELIEAARKQYDTRGEADDEHNLNALLEHFLKVADAVEYAHQKGIIHRDLKPDNIMIGPYNEVYILDWGIARPMTQQEPGLQDTEPVVIAKTAEDFDLFEGSDVYGTPCYMSPEQAAGGNSVLNGQSDLYSLGLILFELLSLKAAYTADPDYNKTIDNSVDGKINALEPYHPQLVIPRELAAVVHKATSRVRKERYAGVGELSDEVRRYLRGEAVLAQPDTPLQKVQRWISHHREKTLLLILLITFLSAVIIAWSLYQRYTDNLAAQRREAAQAQFLNLIRDKSQELNAQFLDIAGITQEFAAGLEQVIDSQPQRTGEVYTFQDLATGQRRPPDLDKSAVYPSAVSLDHLVFKTAPNIEPAALMPRLKTVAPYAPFMKRLFLLSHGKSELNPESPESERLMRHEGVLAADAYAGFEEGFGFTYPMVITNPNYDARQRPWYKIAKGTHGYQWGQPYFDSAGLGWVIPCTKALYDGRQNFRGAVGIDIKVEHISDLMKIPQKPYIKDVYLLNQKGEILLQGSVPAKSYQAGELVNELEQLETFSDPEVLQSIQAQLPSGYFQKPDKTLYTYHYLSSTAWYYLVEAESQTLFSE